MKKQLVSMCNPETFIINMWFRNHRSPSVDIFKVKEVVGETMCIIGGMPISMLTAGSVAQIREHTHEVCESVGKGCGFIICTDILELEGCNPKLVKTWVDATKEYGVYT